MSKLADFYNDTKMRETVEESFKVFLEDNIIDRVFKGKDISGYKEANDVFENWLSMLAREYKPKKEIEKREFDNAE